MVNNNLILKTCHCNNSLDTNYLFNAIFDGKTQSMLIQKSNDRQAEYCVKFCMMSLEVKTKQNQSMFVDLDKTFFMNNCYSHCIKADLLKSILNGKNKIDEFVDINCRLCGEIHKISYRAIKKLLNIDGGCQCIIF